jgi:gluconolactonase
MVKLAGTCVLVLIVGAYGAACAATDDSANKVAASAPATNKVAPAALPGARVDVWDPAMAAIVPKDWKIEKLAEGFGWAEGPIWVRGGRYLLFTDVPGNRMWKWSEKGGLEKFLEPSGAANPDPAIWREAGANGLAILDAKTILVADTGSRAIQKLDLATRKKTPVATAFDGKKLSSPNDVVRARSGVLFFSDPPYGFAKGDDAAQKEMPFNGVYRLGTDGKVSVVEKELQRPNGVALSPDERTLYVTQSVPEKAIMMAYALDAGGNVTGKKLFHDFTDLVGDASPGLPDGLAVAADGTLFVTGPGGVFVLSKDGRRLGRIWDGKATANCKFGDDGKTLYLTSHDMLARIRLNVGGVGFGE